MNTAVEEAGMTAPRSNKQCGHRPFNLQHPLYAEANGDGEYSGVSL